MDSTNRVLSTMAGAEDFYNWRPHFLDADAGVAVWVILGLYVAFLLAIGAYGLYRSCTHDFKSEGGKVNDHYVAGNDMGTYILPLTYFATMFSGYTVVGIPGEVWSRGYFGFRWLGPLLQWYSIYNVVVASRLAFLAKKRGGYQSPTDFIADRFRSKTLTVVVSLTMVFPTIFYVLAQFKSMGGTISGLSDGKISAFDAATVFCIIMLIYENLGGLRGVAWTDAVQGSVMIFCFLFFHITMKDLFGGIAETGDYLENYSDLKTYFDEGNLMSNLADNGTPYPVLPSGSYDKMLNDAQVHSWINFGALMMSYSFYPQMISRCNAAKDTTTLKKALLFTHMGGWISMVSGALTGLIAIKWFGPPGTTYQGETILEKANANDIYGQVMRVAIDSGGGHAFLGTLMITASAAAFMSTADSGLIAASSLLTLDCWRPYIVEPWWPTLPASVKGIFFNDKENMVLILGKLTSIVMGVVILLMTDMDIELGPLFSLQGALLCQVLPAFILGMLIPWIKPFACTLGCVVGVFVLVGIQCDNGMGGCYQEPTWVGPVKEIAPGLLAMFINIAICIVFSVEIWIGDTPLSIRPALLSMPAWDKIPDGRFPGSEFPVAKYCGFDISKTGGPKNRPWYLPQGAFMLILLFIMSFTTPWWRHNDWGKDEEFIAYVPKYIFDLLIIGAIGTVFGWIWILYFWSDDDDLSPDGVIKAGTGETMEMTAPTSEEDGVKTVGMTQPKDTMDMGDVAL